jgi:hypothetical protein
MVKFDISYFGGVLIVRDDLDCTSKDEKLLEGSRWNVYKERFVKPGGFLSVLTLLI